jgi:predicted TIM-barrel fold metal-dependent hydrolase
VDSSNGGQGFTLEGQAEDPFENGLALGATAVVYRSTKRYDRSEFRRRFEEYNLGYGKKGVRYEDILPGSFDPAARIEEQKEDGVDAEVLYNNPLIWAAIKGLKDNELKLACFQAYNDWISEYNGYAPSRLFGGGLVPVTGIDDALAETRRCVEVLGLKSVVMESYPNGSMEEPSPSDDRLWAYVEEVGAPIGVHIGFSFSQKGIQSFGQKGGVTRMQNMDRPLPGTVPAQQKGTFAAILTRLLLGGVFERFPNLKFVGGEINCGWVPNYLHELDTSFRYGMYPEAKLKMLPSEYFRRNVFLTFLPDYFGVRAREIMLENIMWSSDFPHSVSNWPIDAEIAHDQITQNHVPDDQAQKLLWKNCADLYQIEYEPA